MTFSPKNRWILDDPTFKRAARRVHLECVTRFELVDAMCIRRTTRENRALIRHQDSVVWAAIENQREVFYRLMREHSLQP